MKLHKNLIYPFAKIRARQIAQMITPHIDPFATVLDIGCGNMLISQMLTQHIEVRVQGLDVLDMNLTPLPHQIYDGSVFPLKSLSFDTSLLVGVLHHTTNQEQIIKEAKRVTRHKIIVLEDIYTNHLEQKWVKIRDVLGNIPEEPNMPFALSFHSDPEWEQIFRLHNLPVVYKHMYFNPLRLTCHCLYVLSVN